MNKGTIKAVLVTAAGVALFNVAIKQFPQLRRYVG